MPTVPIFSEIQYGFDCQAEMGEITGDVYHYFRRYSDFDVNQWYDNLERPDLCSPTEFQDFRSRHSSEAKKTYLKWFDQDQTLKRGGCTIHGLNGFEYRFNDVIKGVVQDGIYQMVDAGLEDQAIRDTFQNPKLLAPIAQSSKYFTDFVENWKDISERAHILGRSHLQDALQFNIAENQRFDQERIAYYEEIRNRITNHLHENIQLLQDEFSEQKRLTRNKKFKKRERKQRKAVVRSLNVLELFAGKKTTQLFLSGDQIECQGQNFNFIVRKNNLYYKNYNAVAVCVTCKNGEKIADLCWYVKDTYAAEQLVALILATAHGNENEIVCVGNITHTYNTSSPAYKHMLEIRKQYKPTKYLEPEQVPVDYDYDIPSIANLINDEGNIDSSENRRYTTWKRLFDLVKPFCEQNLIEVIPISSLRQTLQTRHFCLLALE